MGDDIDDGKKISKIQSKNTEKRGRGRPKDSNGKIKDEIDDNYKNNNIKKEKDEKINKRKRRQDDSDKK
jgi:hypothetical protein